MSWWKNFKNSRVYRFFNVLAQSAQLAFVLTFVLFFIEQVNSSRSERETLEKLEQVSQSISTRFKGVFPSYLSEINTLINASDPKDTVIIFEDVLYYGCLSQPDEFKKLNKSLLTRATDGNHVVIAYYDVDHGAAFNLMLADKLLGERHPRIFRPDSWSLRDSLFRSKRDADYKRFSKTIDRYLKPLADKMEDGKSPSGRIERDLHQMYVNMDAAKERYLGKQNKNEITYEDYKKMYQEMSHEMERVFRDSGIELIPLKDYLTMSCWMVGESAVIAFPSRYSTEEIGFVSREKAFYNYIHTMLAAVRMENKPNPERP